MLSPNTPAHSEICNATRARPHGYQLRCMEPCRHDGEHLWTPELRPARALPDQRGTAA